MEADVKFCFSIECFYNAMGLPCRHLLAVRRHFKVDVFETQLCATCWTCDYYQDNHRLFCSHKSGSESFTVQSINTRSKVLSQQEKYRKVFSIAQRLSDIA